MSDGPTGAALPPRARESGVYLNVFSCSCFVFLVIFVIDFMLMCFSVCSFVFAGEVGLDVN